MKIKAIETKRYARRFKKPLVTSHGNIGMRRGIIIRISSDNGLYGYGEISTIGGISDASMSEIEGISQKLVGREIEASPDSISKTIIALNTADGCGIESALCDLAAQSKSQPLAEWLSSKKSSRAVPVNFLLLRPVDDWDELRNEIKQGGYRAVKIKIGSASVEEEISFLSDAITKLGPDVSVRLDANQGYDFETAVKVFNNIDLARIEYVEEPMVGSDPAQLLELKKETGIKIALDESITDFCQMESLSKKDFCDAIIIKPARLGSLLKGQAAVSSIVRNGCKVVCTSTLETEIGIAAQLHMVASWNIDLLPCGLDTLRLFESYDANLFGVHDGEINLPIGNGIGCGDALWETL